MHLLHEIDMSNLYTPAWCIVTLDPVHDPWPLTPLRPPPTITTTQMNVEIEKTGFTPEFVPRQRSVSSEAVVHDSLVKPSEIRNRMRLQQGHFHCRGIHTCIKLCPNSCQNVLLDWGAVVAQWIRPQTLNHEGPWFESAGSGSSALGQGTLSSLPNPSEGT